MLTWIDNILKPICLCLDYIYLKIHICTYPTDILRLIYLSNTGSLYLLPFGQVLFNFHLFCDGDGVMPVRGLIHDGQLRACPCALLGLMYSFKRLYAIRYLGFQFVGNDIKGSTLSFSF